MYEPEDDDVYRTIACIVVGGALLLFVMFSCIGCATTKCPECVPEIQTIEVLKPVYSCPGIDPLPTLELPQYPTAPSELTDEAVKSWYAEMSATVKAREALLRRRILSLEELIAALPNSD